MYSVLYLILAYKLIAPSEGHLRFDLCTKYALLANQAPLKLPGRETQLLVAEFPLLNSWEHPLLFHLRYTELPFSIFSSFSSIFRTATILCENFYTKRLFSFPYSFFRLFYFFFFTRKISKDRYENLERKKSGTVRCHRFSSKAF